MATGTVSCLLAALAIAGIIGACSLFTEYNVINMHNLNRSGRYQYCNMDHPAYPGIDKLPPLVQTSQRILICNSYGGRPQKHSHIMENQLDAYIEMCERGWEVHIAFMAERNKTSLEQAFRPNRLFCKRINASIPVVAAVPIPGRMIHAAAHRDVWYKMLKESYDFYATQEDDALVTHHHLHYFERWNTFLAGTNNIPGFVLFEYLQEIPSDTKYLISTTYDNNAAITLFYANHHLLLRPLKSQSVMNIVPREDVERVVRMPFWKDEIALYVRWIDDYSKGKRPKALPEMNPHFTFFWMLRNRNSRIESATTINAVIPMVEFVNTLIHHQPNKYVNIGPLSHDSIANHNYRIATDEYLAATYSCLGEPFPPTRVCPDIFFDSTVSTALKHKACIYPNNHIMVANTKPWDINITYIAEEKFVGDLKYELDLATFQMNRKKMVSLDNQPLCNRCLQASDNRILHISPIWWKNRDTNFTKRRSTAEGELICSKSLSKAWTRK